MFLANQAGIDIFATGGIGGVHRDAIEPHNPSFDISADLTELSKTPVMVVSAGIKSILDIPKTIEYLETFHVPVLAYKTNELPSFYSKNSGITVPKIESARHAARLLENHKLNLNQEAGILMTVPPPVLNTIDMDTIQSAVNEALKSAAKDRIVGKDFTPYVLGKVKEYSDGQSVKLNLKLVENNIEKACKISIEYSEIRSKSVEKIKSSD